MPIYEYACRTCGKDFEFLVRGAEIPECPHCRSNALDKLVSIAAGHVRQGKGAESAPHAGGCGRPQCGTGGCMGLG